MPANLPERRKRQSQSAEAEHGHLTAARLRELLDYDPDTGQFTWRVNKSWKARAGSIAGTCKKKGYIEIVVLKVSYGAHRLAWLHAFGRWPVGFIDHVNGVGTDNRLANLREATNSQNQANRFVILSTSGHKGVTWHKQSKKWQAQIKVAGRSRYLGLFDTKTAAASAYARAAATIFGAYANFRGDQA